MQRAAVALLALLAIAASSANEPSELHEDFKLGWSDSDDELPDLTAPVPKEAVADDSVTTPTDEGVDGELPAFITAATDIGVVASDGKIRTNDIRRCEGVCGMLEKRDDKEEKRVKSEMALLELVRVQLSKLNQVGKLKSNAAQAEVQSLLATLSLDVGRDYSEVNGPDGIFSLLNDVEKKMKAQLEDMREETANNIEHCKNMCSSSVKKAKVAHHLAKAAQREAREELEAEDKKLEELEGTHDEAVADHKAAQAKHDEEDAVRAKELATLQILTNKLSSFKKSRNPETATDLQVKSLSSLKDEIKHQGEEVSTQFAQVYDALSAKEPETNEIEELLKGLSDKILKERAVSNAHLKKLLDGIAKLRNQIEAQKVKVELATAKLTKTKAHVREMRRQLDAALVACKRFL